MTDKLAGDPSYEAGRAAHAEATRTPNPGSPATPTRCDDGSRQSGPTPGPWLIDGTYVYEDDATGRTIADCRRSTRHMGECRANARLIAAAPDLRYVLSRILEDLPVRRDWLDPDIEKMGRDAIAKADGRA